MDKTSGKDRINEIIDTIIRVARGDYSAQIELSGINDDIDSLAMGINMMINDIENAIIKQKKTEAEIREINKQLQRIIDSSPAALMTVDIEGKITSWSPASEEIFGWSEDEVIGKFNPTVPKNMKTVFLKTIKGKQTNLELKCLNKNDSLVDILISTVPLLNEKGKFIGALGVMTDITERKKIEEELSIKKNAIESSFSGIGITDLDGKITYVNDAIVKMCGCKDSNEIIGRTLQEFWEGERIFQTIKNLKEKGFDKGEDIGKRKDGSFFNVIFSANIIKDEKGKSVAILGSFMDITEKKKAEEKIIKQNVQLRKLDELKTAFLNITSHELRTPMSAIKGYTQMLLKQTFGDINVEQKNSLDIILRNTNRLDGLIQDILDVSRLESRTMKFIPEKTDIKKLVGQTTETVQPSADRKEITINADVEEGITNLIVDEERIKQVMINIVGNAIKFSPDGSIINVKARKEKNDVLFEVQDFGRGIPKDKLDKVFETFYQVDSGADRKFGGAGLGLAISRGIVISHGGKIWVESKEGNGSKFSFTLPVKPVKNAEKKFKTLDMFGLDKIGGSRND